MLIGVCERFVSAGGGGALGAMSGASASAAVAPASGEASAVGAGGGATGGAATGSSAGAGAGAGGGAEPPHARTSAQLANEARATDPNSEVRVMRSDAHGT